MQVIERSSSEVKRFAVFTDCFDQINGVGSTYRYLAEFCEREALPLDIFTLGSTRSTEEHGTVRIFRFNPRIPVRYYGDLSFDLRLPASQIVRTAAQSKYHLIHAATPGSIGLNGLYLSRRLRVPLVGCYHTAIPEYADQRREQLVRNCSLPGSLGSRSCLTLGWFLMSAFYNRCDLVLAPTRIIADALVERLSVPVRIFSRGVDAFRYSPRHRVPSRKVTALYVGRVSVEKNLPVLADLFRNRPDLQLKVVGDGPFLKELKGTLPSAEFTGFLTGEPLSRAYASADYFVFPSETDTLGNVVLEAMSSGLPVIVSDKMGPRELVRHGETGFVAGNRKDFGRYSDLLSRDSSLRLEMGRKARRFALTRTWKDVFEELFQTYGEVAQPESFALPGAAQDWRKNWGVA